MLVLGGCSAILFVASVATSSDLLFASTQWTYVAAGSCYLVHAAIATRRVGRQWAEASQPAFDPTLVGDEPDVIVRRLPRAARLSFIAIGLVSAGFAIKIFLDLSKPLWRLIFASGLLALAAYAASFAGAMLVATVDLVAVRTNFQWRTAAWREVLAVEPRHEGIAFELRDGRRLVAFATSKNGLTFMRPRYDKALLDDLRARIR
ncbi:MAG: hypothetical protein QOD92_1120 [Acidimicrobiaceae bacterium]|jgi:hypothetical protein